MDPVIKHEESLIVFTHRAIKLLLDLNGSLAWKVDPDRARKCKYIVCARNTNHGLADIVVPHGTAFLIGKVSGISPGLNLPRDHDRWMIKFDKYAELNIKDVWDGQRWPVKYFKTKELKKVLLDIDVESLDWQTVPKQDLSYIDKYFEKENEFLDSKGRNMPLDDLAPPPSNPFIIKPDRGIPLRANIRKREEKYEGDSANEGVGPLTISQAKSGLSNQYDIPEENIEIILKG